MPAIEVLEVRCARDPAPSAPSSSCASAGSSSTASRSYGQKPWVALPQQPARVKADGKGAGWYPVLEASPPLMERIRAVVLAAWQEAQL